MVYVSGGCGYGYSRRAYYQRRRGYRGGRRVVVRRVFYDY